MPYYILNDAYYNGSLFGSVVVLSSFMHCYHALACEEPHPDHDSKKWPVIRLHPDTTGYLVDP